MTVTAWRRAEETYGGRERFAGQSRWCGIKRILRGGSGSGGLGGVRPPRGITGSVAEARGDGCGGESWNHAAFEEMSQKVEGTDSSTEERRTSPVGYSPARSAALTPVKPRGDWATLHRGGKSRL